MSRVQPARQVALDVLRAVEHDDAYANLLLPQRIVRARLGAQDAGLATELTYGTLRLRGYYDRVIALAARRSTDAIDPALLDVLRLGTHQLLSTRVAVHAAVDESVELARQVGSRSGTGFVNGVLRTISRSTPDEWRGRVLAGTTGEDDRLAAEWSHPAWVVRAFRRSLAAEGRESELVDLLSADNDAPKVSLVALPGLAEVSELGAPSARLSPLAATSGGGDPAQQTAVREGRARVQDEGSQLAALLLSRHRAAVPGERWLDMCAGPGGKAALLGAEAARVGAHLVANELVPARARSRCSRGTPRGSGWNSPVTSTASSSTRPAPVSEPFVGGPRHAGANSRPTWASSRRCSRASSPARWTPWRPGESSPTSPARRTRPRPVVSSRRGSGAAVTSSCCSTPRPASSASPVDPSTWHRHRSSSSGRTATARTRCSSP